MKRNIAILGLLALAVCAWAVSHLAVGRGVFRIGDDSRGVFRFIVANHNDRVEGALEFKQMRRGEDRPVAVVMLRPVRVSEFLEHSAQFGGIGKFNGHEVMVGVRVLDGPPDGHDAFAIECKNRDGQVVYSAAGELAEGNIEISHRRD